MTPDLFIQNRAAEAVKTLFGVQLSPGEFQVQVTRKEFEGDYTLVAFPLSRLSHKSPEATASALGEWLRDNVPEIAHFNAVKGFLNLSFSPVYWLESLQEAGKEDFGQLPSTGRRVMVEFSSPNTNKPLHLGHIRNNLLGDSVSRILKACGNEVIKSTIVNDRGVHICKSMLAWQKVGGGRTPESTGIKGDHLVGDMYVAFNDIFKAEVDALTKSGMDKAEAERQAPCIKEAHQMLLKWEQGDPAVRELWSMMNSWVLEGFDQSYKALGISFDRTYYESQTYLLGKELVQKGLDMGIFERQEDGSVWCDLTEDGLDRKLLLRSDGTSVYITQDLGTAESRFSEFNLDEHVYVVGNEQDYHFQVLKLILKKLGFSWADAIFHLSYGMVELPEGKMKSREGTVVDADDLIEKMYLEAKQTSLESGKLEDLPGEQREELFRMIGLGALKYFIIKVDPKKTMLFDPKESIDFNGNTGPFIQYTHARICSILRKARAASLYDPTAAVDMGVEPLAKEIRLIKLIGLFPSKVAEAGASLAPSVLANYSYELAKDFNQYYHDTQILPRKDEGAEEIKAGAATRGFRLSLIATLATVLSKAMGLLGIQLPERM